MNLVELDKALRKLRLSGMANVLETRLLQAQTEQMAPIDLLAALVSDELQRREDRLLERRHKQARFRDPDRALDGFDFDFNKKINRALVFELATARFIAKREDILLVGPTRYREESPRPGHRTRRHPAGLPRPLPRNAHLPRRTRRGDARRDPQGIPRRAGPRAPAHHRRPRHAQAATHRRRGPARADHAPLRAGLDDAHLQPAGRRVGEAARRHRRGHRTARPAPASRTRAQVRAAQLAHPGADHPGRVDGRRVTVGSRSDIAPASEGVRSFPPVAPALRSRAEDSRAANVNAHPDVVRARDGAASRRAWRNHRCRTTPPSPRAPDEPSAALEWSLDGTPASVRRRRPHRPAQPAVPSREGTPTGHDQHQRPARNPPGAEPERPSIRSEHYLADAVADQCARIHRLRLDRAADRFTGSVT